MSFHKINLGKFGEDLPTDLDGYVHTSAKGWMGARMDAMTWRGYSYAEKYDRCKEMAAESREAVKESEAALTEWRKNNAFEKAEAEAKVAIKALGYGPRFYAGKCHAIKGLKDGETYHQEQFPGGYSSWQETLAAITE